MSLPIPVTTWLEWGQITQFLRTEDDQTRAAFSGGGPDNFFGLLLAIVNQSVAAQYAASPNDPNLLVTAPYLICLIGRYQIPARRIIANLALTKPSFTGPSSETTTVGTPVTFTITPTGGATPISYQWYQNGMAIIGAIGTSYTIPSPQLSQSGNIYTVIATNPAGSVPSNPVTLTVTASIEGFLYYTSTNPGPTLQASSDPFSYQASFAITHDSPWVITVPSAATPNMYIVIKGPSTESIKTLWANGTFNSGNIPDAIFEAYLQFGGQTYYYTRVAATFDATQSLTLT